MKELPEGLEEATTIDDTDIKGEFVRVPGQLAYWHSQYADSIQAHLNATATRRQVEANLYQELREQWELTGAKVTEAALEKAVRREERWRAAHDAEAAAEADRERHRGWAWAVAAKRDCLISLGAAIRTELEREPIVRREASGLPVGADGW